MQQKKPEKGMLIEFAFGTEKLKGIIIKEEQKHYLIKLTNGYTIGVKKEKLTNFKVLEKGILPKKPASKKPLHFPGKPNIAVLHTGGTIASRIDYRTGAVMAGFTDEDFLSIFPKLEGLANYKNVFLANMWSDDVTLRHYPWLAGKTFKYVLDNSIDGIIIGFGTDTMHYASAALAFMIENPNKPIIFVGSQRSSDRPSTDAFTNLKAATLFIEKTDFNGVAIAMHNTTNDNEIAILPACKTRKMHSSARYAFKAINSSPYAIVNVETEEITFLREYPKKNSKEPILRNNIETNVALLKIYPGIDASILQHFIDRKLEGLVIEGTGLGHAPLYEPNELSKGNKEFGEKLKQLIDNGCVVVMTTQCLYGSVNMNVYNKGRDLQSMGIIPCKDMLPETALIKLAWLLGNFPKEEVKELMLKNMAGEFNDRLQLE